MAVQVSPITQSLPATTAIQDPATRRFAQAVEDALRALRSEEGAVESLKKAADAMNNAVAGGTPPSIAQWLFSSELYQKLTTEIARVDTQAKQDVLDEALARQTAIDEINATLATIQSTAAYDPATTYAVGDMVTYDGRLYQAILETTGNLPTNTTYWKKVGDYATLGDVVAAHTLEIDDLDSRVTTNAGNLTAEIASRQALATQVRGSYTGTDVNQVSQGLIYSERVARATADSNEVAARQSLSAKLLGATSPDGLTLETLSEGLVFDERQARVSGDGANASSISALRAQVGVTEAGALTTGLILDEKNVRASNDNAIVSAVNTALAQITGVSTSISQSGENLIASWSQAQASKWSQIESEVLTAGGQTIRAALQQESNARATLAGQVSATWTVKAEVDSGTGKPYIAGLALGASGQGGATTSEFIVRADALKVMMPGYGDYVPFAIGNFGPAMFGDGGFSVPVSHIVNQAAQPTSFLETFESGDLSQWVNYHGSGELSVVSVADSMTGGKVLRIGNNSGNDQAWMVHKQNIPFDPSALYRIKFRVRRTAGTGTVYLGLAGVAANGVTWVNATGINDVASQHYIAASNQSPGSTWTEYVGYVKGTAATGQTGTNPPVTTPLKLHQNVKYIRPLILMNFPSATGTAEVDYCSIERMTDAMSWDGVSGSGKDALVTTASTALTNANAAQQDADTANAALADIAADNKLTPAEKQAIRKEWDTIYAERAGIRAQADSFGITTEKTNYDNDFQALGTYLNGGTAYTIGATPPSWITDANLATTTAIVGSTFRANWSNLYANRQALLNKISAEAAKRADWAVISGVGKPEDGATVGADDSNYTGSRGNNLLRNSMLKDSTAGWGYALGPGCVLGEFRTTLNENGAPKGYGALKLGFSGTASSAYESQVYCGDLAVPCVPGERIELGARVGVYRGDAQLTASFLLSDGSFTLYVPVTGGVAEATNQTAWTQSLSDLQHLWGFVAAPANAVKCYMEVRVKRTTTVAPTDLYIALPYIGKAGSAQTIYSPWNQGAFITPSEVTTWIANATIGNAEIDRASINKLRVVTADIQDLAVQTLKIAGNAVTVPVTASGGYNNGDGFQNWKTACILPITLDHPALVYVHGVLSQAFPYGDRTWGAFISVAGQNGMTVGGQRLADSVSVTAAHTLGVGTHYITLYWSSDSGGDVISSSLFALAVKR